MICQPGFTAEANCTHLVSSISDKASAVLPLSARRPMVHSDSLISLQASIDAAWSVLQYFTSIWLAGIGCEDIYAG